MPKKKEELQENERELATRHFDSYGNYEIYRQGGGHVPEELRGIYTTGTSAKNALSRYNEKMGKVDELKKIKSQVKAIQQLDHTYDGV